MTPRESWLSAIIDALIREVEESACTCADPDTRNRLHSAPGRRRKDSACRGVALAVRADLLRRRALRSQAAPDKGTYLYRCIDNSGFEELLEVGAEYIVVADPKAERQGSVRVFDRTIGNRLFPATHFLSLDSRGEDVETLFGSENLLEEHD